MPRKPKQARSKATVDAILGAGFTVVARNGVGGATTRAIADAAGVGVGSLYEYFPNKQAVLDAMQERLSADLVEFLRPVLVSILGLDIPDAIRTLLREIREFLERDAKRYLGFVRGLLSTDQKLRLEPVTKLLGELVLQYMLRHPELTRLGNAAAMTYIFIHGGTAVVVLHLSDPAPPITYDELVEGLATMVGHTVEHSKAIASGL